MKGSPMQGMVMACFGGLMIGLGVLLLVGGIKAYLAVMVIPQ